MAIIELIIIIWVVVVVVKKSQKKGGNAVANKNNMPNRQNISPRTQQNTAGTSQAELKRRLQEKYAGYVPGQNGRSRQKPVAASQPAAGRDAVSGQKSGILARAERNVAEDFEEKPVSQSSGAVYQSAKTGQEQMTGAVYQMSGMAQKSMGSSQASAAIKNDIPQMQQESELMKMVSDIMAKGVDTRIPFERDFVAEGMDMINKMTL